MKLTDTQSLILSAASQHADGIALPLPKSLRGGAANKVIDALIKHGLLKETYAHARKGEPVWRTTKEGDGVTLVITDFGYDAIGVDRPQREQRPALGKVKAPKAPKAAKADGEAPAPRGGTKQAQMIEMLRRNAGATVDEIVEATGWQKHTVRSAMAGALKKRLGLTIVATPEERGRVYRIA